MSLGYSKRLNLNSKIRMLHPEKCVYLANSTWIKYVTLTGKVLCFCWKEKVNKTEKSEQVVNFSDTKRNKIQKRVIHKDTVWILGLQRGFIPFLVVLSVQATAVIWKLRLPIESQIQLDIWGKMSDLLSRLSQAPFINLADITLSTSPEPFQTTFNRTITSLICNNSLLFFSPSSEYADPVYFHL